MPITLFLPITCLNMPININSVNDKLTYVRISKYLALGIYHLAISIHVWNVWKHFDAVYDAMLWPFLHRASKRIRQGSTGQWQWHCIKLYEWFYRIPSKFEMNFLAFKELYVCFFNKGLVIATGREGEEGEKVDLKICLAVNWTQASSMEGESTDHCTKEEC